MGTASRRQLRRREAGWGGSLRSSSELTNRKSDTRPPEQDVGDFQAFDGSVSLPAAGYNYNSDWTPHVGGTLTRWNCS
jgi:hypothetical protein